jgi:6-methylsalicylate decarboxylase
MSVQTGPGAGLRFIDVHHHCVLPSRPLRKNSDPDALIETMASFGIDGALVNPLSVAGVHHGNDENARYLCETTGEALAKFVSGHPKKLGFFAPVPFPDVDGALKQTAYALDVLKADGIILLTNQNGIYIGDPAADDFYAELNRRKANVFVHPARASFVDDLTLKLWGSVVEYPFETTRIAANLIYNEQMRKYPHIRWILAHAGGCLPYISLRLKLMSEQDPNGPPDFKDRVPEGPEPYVGKFYFDTAISGSRAAMASLRLVTDPSHIMFGSDWPYIHREYVDEQITNMRSMPELADIFAQVERENAQKLFARFA